MLCDYAKARDGLVNIVGGGIGRLTLDPLPGPLLVHVVLLVEFSGDEASAPHELSIQVYDDERARPIGSMVATLAVGQRAVDLSPSERVVVPLVANLAPLGIPTSGMYSVHTRVDRETGPVLSLRVLPAN